MFKPMDCKNMNDIREAIDSIDENIVKLISKEQSMYKKHQSLNKAKLLYKMKRE